MSECLSVCAFRPRAWVAVSPAMAILCNILFLEDQILRLRGGDYSHQGRVEVYYEREWGTVCDNSRASRNAMVACRQLGYEEGLHFVLKSDVRMESRTVYRISCSGSESSFLNCSVWKDSSCGHSDELWITCSKFIVKPNTHCVINNWSWVCFSV